MTTTSVFSSKRMKTQTKGQDDNLYTDRRRTRSALAPPTNRCQRISPGSGPVKRETVGKRAAERARQG